ncbi:acyltransferase-like protein [Mucilaginibacter gracilis]|uniref:Acyltransferase-like protein n=1 Tax=Mucilaginibacter gracilis TaxID=423350 RepID=A0A495JAF7_9SPHI|nr:lysophospholipid acyltransferase family protein [Mucilaginibacter gracilis]RKR85342.1 acyltransferase-like protein [Mucilaginibacter gracilis]
MLKPKPNFFITGFFDFYIEWIIRRCFHKVEFNKPGFDAGKSILLIANHFSWWDGFLMYHINKAVFKKKFHIMVLEESMQKINFLKYLGAFSVAKTSRQVLQSLAYAAGLLEHPDNIVVIFPQGKLYSNFVDDVDFQKGAVYIAEKANANFQYVLSATFTENFQYKKPTAHIYLKVLNVNAIVAAQLPAQFKQHYQAAKQQQTNLKV